MALLQRVCELDLEGIVAKQKSAPYVTEREQSTWFKILNRDIHRCRVEKNYLIAASGTCGGMACLRDSVCGIRGSELSAMVYFFSAAAPARLPLCLDQEV